MILAPSLSGKRTSFQRRIRVSFWETAARKATGETAFEKAQNTSAEISDQEFFDHGTLMVAFVKAGVELAYETMTSTGIVAESAYYESLHEAPLIANTIARKKLYEMNRIISDTT